jgi:hypothetical protein
MATTLYLQGVDRESKDAELYSNDILVGHGSISGPKGYMARYIAEIAEQHGIDAKRFMVIFRVYKMEVLTLYKNSTVMELEKLPREERSKIHLGTETEYEIKKKDIEWLREFSKELIEKIERGDNYEKIKKKAYSHKPNESIRDVLSDYEYKCFEVWGYLKPLLAICEKALELGVDIKHV